MGSARSARPENGRKVENGRKMLVLGGAETHKFEILGDPIGGIGRSERRFLECLKGNGETESFKRPELATNHQKHNEHYDYQLGIIILSINNDLLTIIDPIPGR